MNSSQALMFILIARVHAKVQNLIQYVWGGVWILPFCHMMTVLHAWITLRVAKYHFPWPPQRLCAIKYPLSYLFILQPILTFSVYSMFKTTVIITAPSLKPPSCLSFPFQSKTYFHLQFTLLWYHFSPRSSVASVSPGGLCHSYPITTLQHLMPLSALSF